jgi:amino acid adenylation domain-containing protein
MKNIEEIILHLKDEGIQISTEDGKLIIRAKHGVLSDELKIELKKNKEKLIAFLANNTDSNESQIIRSHNCQAPLTFAQQGLWLIDQTQNGSPEYNMPMAFELQGRLDVILVEQIFKTILERHEILRSVYELVEGEPHQIVRSKNDIDFTVQYYDFSLLEAKEQRREIEVRATDDLNTPFDLKNDVMLRVSFLKTGDETAVLLVNLHHIASDGWSLEVLKNEFFLLYHAYSRGKPNPLSKLKIQYSDYSNWQRKRFKEDTINSQLEYWKKQLSELPLIHNLKTDFLRPPVKKFEGTTISTQLSKHVASSLAILAKRHQLTPFMLLHAGLALVLSRHSNSNDIVVGTPAGNRLQVAIEPLIGLFVNTLVLRVNTGYVRLDEYFSHARQVHLDAQSNREVPFEKIVEKLDIQRSKSYTPLFQIIMRTDFGNASTKRNPSEELSSSHLKVKSFKSEKVISKFDLDVNMGLLEDGVMIEWSYDKHLFSKEHVEQFNDHLCRVLTSFSQLNDHEAERNPSIRSLPMLSSAEVDDLLGVIDEKQNVASNPLLVHQLFEQQVAETPEKIAVTFNGTKLSYADANAKANQLANYLLSKSIGKGDYIGILSHRSLGMIVATLAVVKCGAAYIPFNPDNTAERNTQIIRESNLKLVFVQTELEERLSAKDIERVPLCNLLDETNWLDEFESVAPLIDINKEDSVYVIYTSGSTGTPKGVEVSHGGLQEYLLFSLQNYYASHLDGSLLLTSHAFDISNPSIYLPLLTGDRVDLLGNGNVFEMLKKVLESSPSSNYLLRMTPNHAFALLELLPKHVFMSKHVFVIGGETLTASLAKELQARFPLSQIYNHYGPTEAVVGCTIYDVTNQLDEREDYVPIGYPMDNVELYVLNSNLELLPKTVVGELYIGRSGLAKGYLNQTELTSKSFITNPFYNACNPLSSPRLYKTGDLVRFLQNGSLMFIGRCDDQVKIRGFRVELEEIEHRINQIKDVQSNIVIAREDKFKQKCLVAYVQVEDRELKSNQDIITQIRLEIGVHLPAYMIPSFFVLVDEWPLSANGKVDKNELPEPCISTKTDFVRPETDTELALVKIWSELLNIGPTKIGSSSDFFELGGHSLLIIRLMTLIKKEFFVEPTLSTLFDINTLREQASSIDSAIIMKKMKKQMEVSKSEIEWL